MMSRTLFLSLVLAACVGFFPAAAGAADVAADKPFVHPGMLQSRADLDFMKKKVLAGEQPWKSAWDRLRSSPNASLDFQPKPFAHVIRGPYNNPAIGSNEMSASADAAYGHAIQWYVTGDKAHARKVIQIFSAWSPVLEDFQQNDAKLLAGWTGHQFLNAAEILRSTDSGWEEKDIAQFKKMILGVYYPLIKDFFPEANGNWDAAMIDTMLCIGIFFDDRKIFDRAVEQYLRGPINGGITHYVYPSGQCQESTRDQGHTQLGLGELALASQVAWNQGVDLYGAADNRLALGFEYTARYMLGDEVLCEDVISPIGRGRVTDIYQVVYQHYRFVKGMNMPYTAKAAEGTLERSRSVLTLWKGPSGGGPTATSGSPKPSAIAAQGGAAAVPTARPPADAIVVLPGQSIQTALDGPKGAAGWVVLDKGVHTLPAALRLPSGVTLSGQGGATVLMLDPKLTGPAIVNADDALHDVTLRDLIIEGARSSKLPGDPNSARRPRARPDAPARGGIRLAAKDDSLRNIRLERLTVRNCTESGVSIAGATGIVVTACSFTDNGARVAPGAGTHHNLSLLRVSQCQVIDSRLNNSPAGSGANIASSRDVTLAGCEIARSVFWGVWSNDSQDIRIRSNLVEGNEAGGIQFGADKDGCRRIEVRDNRVQNNGGYGIEITRTVEGSARGNELIDNGRENQMAVTASERILQ
jgi:parallel beta-helix repeat protein